MENVKEKLNIRAVRKNNHDILICVGNFTILKL